MKKTTKTPMPTVEFDGKTYTLSSRKTKVPDFSKMSHIEAGWWIRAYTYPRYYKKNEVG